MRLLAFEENKSHFNKKICFICQEKFEINDDINYHKIRDHCHYTKMQRCCAW